MIKDMTPGTEAKMPERIFATLNYSPVGPVLQGTLTVEPSEAAEQVEYIRADVALAMVAEAETAVAVLARAYADALAALEAVKEQAPTWLTRCNICNRPVDMREPTAGGDDHGAELSEEMWVCSSECWDEADRADTQEGEG